MKNINSIVLPLILLATNTFTNVLAQNTFDDKTTIASSQGSSKTMEYASKVAEKAYNKAEWVFENAGTVHYEHRHLPAEEQIHVQPGGDLEAATDCSGFISYVLHSVCPKHYEAVKVMDSDSLYPKAKVYAHFFASLSPDTPSTTGWQKINNIYDLKKGDLIAWEKEGTAEDHGGHGNNGHVAMVIEQPTRATTETIDNKTIRYSTINVIDSSSVYHFSPEVLPPHSGQTYRDGLGKGCIRIILSDQDQPIGYWEGTLWGGGHKEIKGPSYTNMVEMARLIHRPS